MQLLASIFFVYLIWNPSFTNGSAINNADDIEHLTTDLTKLGLGEEGEPSAQDESLAAAHLNMAQDYVNAISVLKELMAAYNDITKPTYQVADKKFLKIGEKDGRDAIISLSNIEKGMRLMRSIPVEATLRGYQSTDKKLVFSLKEEPIILQASDVMVPYFVSNEVPSRRYFIWNVPSVTTGPEAISLGALDHLFKTHGIVPSSPRPTPAKQVNVDLAKRLLDPIAANNFCSARALCKKVPGIVGDRLLASLKGSLGSFHPQCMEYAYKKVVAKGKVCDSPLPLVLRFPGIFRGFCDSRKSMDEFSLPDSLSVFVQGQLRRQPNAALVNVDPLIKLFVESDEADLEKALFDLMLAHPETGGLPSSKFLDALFIHTFKFTGRSDLIPTYLAASRQFRSITPVQAEEFFKSLHPSTCLSILSKLAKQSSDHYHDVLVTLMRSKMDSRSLVYPLFLATNYNGDLFKTIRPQGEHLLPADHPAKDVTAFLTLLAGPRGKAVLSKLGAKPEDIALFEEIACQKFDIAWVLARENRPDKRAKPEAHAVLPYEWPLNYCGDMAHLEQCLARVMDYPREYLTDRTLSNLNYFVQKSVECGSTPEVPEDRRRDKSRLVVGNFNAEWLYLFGGQGTKVKCPGPGCPAPAGCRQCHCSDGCRHCSSERGRELCCS